MYRLIMKKDSDNLCVLLTQEVMKRINVKGIELIRYEPVLINL